MKNDTTTNKPMDNTKKIYTAQIIFTQGHDLYDNVPWATEKELADSIGEALSYTDSVNVTFTPVIEEHDLSAFLASKKPTDDDNQLPTAP